MKKNGVAATIVLFAVLVLAVTVTVQGIGRRASGSQTGAARNAVRWAALACYAAEGAYPDNLDYLKKYYGLAYDENVVSVSYEAFASNIFPDIYVTERSVGR